MYPIRYIFTYTMIIVKTLVPFQRWFKKLADRQAKARIQARLDMIAELGHFGDCKMVENPVCELRFFFGAGYRVYYIYEQEQIIVLLSGGDKASQQDDIEKAVALAKAYLNSQGESNE